jgi:hypothetical protein
MHPHDGPAYGGLAGARLAHQGQGLALVQLEAYAAHSTEGLAAIPKVTEMSRTDSSVSWFMAAAFRSFIPGRGNAGLAPPRATGATPFVPAGGKDGSIQPGPQPFDRIRSFHRRSPGVQEPGLGPVGLAYGEEGRLMLEIHLEGQGIPGSKGVALISLNREGGVPLMANSSSPFTPSWGREARRAQV